MKAVILAGGLGSRLKPFTEIIPKPLLPIGEKSILEIQIERLKKFGFNKIFLATNHKSRYIENFFGDGSQYGVELVISKESKPLGTIGPLSLLKNHLTEPFIVMNGDILTTLDFRAFYKTSQALSSLICLGIKEYITPFRFGNIIFEDDYILAMEEKPNIKTHILAGVYYFHPQIFDYIPDDTYFGIDSLVGNLLREKIKVCKYEISDYWLDIGIAEDYERAQKEFHKFD